MTKTDKELEEIADQITEVGQKIVDVINAKENDHGPYVAMYALANAMGYIIENSHHKDATSNMAHVGRMIATMNQMVLSYLKIDTTVEHHTEIGTLQ